MKPLSKVKAETIGSCKRENLWYTLWNSNGKEPLTGRRVSLKKGTTNGNTSDFDGKIFSLKISNDNASLIVFLCCFATKRVSVNQQINLTIPLRRK